KAGCDSRKTIVIGVAPVVREAFDRLADFFSEGLDAYFKLQRTGGKFGDHFAQGRGQTVRDHLEMKEMAGLITFEQELEDRFADVDVQVKSAIYKFELANAAFEQTIQFMQQPVQRKLAHRNIKR